MSDFERARREIKKIQLERRERDLQKQQEQGAHEEKYQQERKQEAKKVDDCVKGFEEVKDSVFELLQLANQAFAEGTGKVTRWNLIDIPPHVFSSVSTYSAGNGIESHTSVELGCKPTVLGTSLQIPNLGEMLIFSTTEMEHTGHFNGDKLPLFHRWYSTTPPLRGLSLVALPVPLQKMHYVFCGEPHLLCDLPGDQILGLLRSRIAATIVNMYRHRNS